MNTFEIENDNLELAAGQTAELNLRIVNNSKILDKFMLSLEPNNQAQAGDLDPAWLRFSLPTFDLRPLADGVTPQEGENQQTVRLTISLPPNLLAGTYNGFLLLTPQTNRHEVTRLPFSVVVSQVESQLFEVQPPAVTSHKASAFYDVILANQGNTSRFYAVYAEDDEDACRFELTPAEVELPPGTNTRLRLKVQPRERNWTTKEKVYPFVVGLEGYNQRAQATFTQQHGSGVLYAIAQRPWRSAFLILLPIIAIIALVVFLLLPPINVKLANCGPLSLREVNVAGNGVRTQIFVSGPRGTPSERRAAIVEESADVLPGLFASLIAVSPDGRKMAYITASNPALEKANIIIVDLETQQRQAVPDVPAGLWPVAPIWSADGEKLAFMVRPKTGLVAAPVAATTAAGGIVVPITIRNPAETTTPTGGAVNASPTQLEMWLVTEMNKPPKKLLPIANLETDLFYGDESRNVCWNSDNNGLIIRPKSAGFENSQLEVDLEGKARRTARPGGANTVATSLPADKASSNTPTNAPLPANRAFAFAPDAAIANSNAAADSPCIINKPYSQNDPRWSDRLLKNAEPGKVAVEQGKLADFGCAITGAAMLLNYYGLETITPPDLLGNNCLGSLAAPLLPDNWGSLGRTECSNSQIRNFVRSSFDWTDLNTNLQKGPTLVGLLGGQTGTHYVIVNSGLNSDADNYKITDPWDGTTYKTLGYFLKKGYRLGWIVTYEGTAKNCIPTGAANPASIEVLSGVQNEKIQDGQLFRERRSLYFTASGTISTTVQVSTRTGDLNSFNLRPQTLVPNQDNYFEEDGIYIVTIQAVGTNNANSVRRVIYFSIDKTPPIIGATPSLPPDQKTKKYSVPITVQLKAQDAVSGIRLIEYRKTTQDGEDTGWQLYNSDTTNTIISLDRTANFKIYYRATDGAGNITEVGSSDFEVEIANRPGSQVTPVTSVVTPPPTPRPTTAPPTIAPTATIPPTVAPRPTTAAPTATATFIPTATALPTPTFTPTLPPPTFTPIVEPTATFTPVTVAVPANTTPPASLAAKLENVNGPLVFEAGVSTKKFDLQNSGTGALSWNLLPGTSAGVLRFNPSFGTINAGQAAAIEVTLLVANSTRQDKNYTIEVNSNGGNIKFEVVVKPETVPSAVISAPTGGATLDANATITLAVNVPTGAKVPDHATLSVNFKVCPTCPAIDVTLPDKPRASNNWTITWNTSQILPQNTISLRGKLCTSTDDSICTDITPVTNLKIEADITFSAPVANAVLQANTTVSVKPTGRTTRVLLTAVTNDGQVPVLGELNAANNWTLIWDTLRIVPGTTVTLKAKTCTGSDNNSCQDVTTQVSGLLTKMQAQVAFSQDLAVNKTLPITLTVTITPTTNVAPNSNINHVSLYATYSTGGGAPATTRLLTNVVPRPSTNPPWQAIWDTTLIPAQKSISLEVKACFFVDESKCDSLQILSGLEIAPGAAALMTVKTGSQQNGSTNSPFPVNFTVLVTDVKNNPVSGIAITFSAPITGTTGIFSTANNAVISAGGFTATVATNEAGIATAPTFTANGNLGAYEIIVTGVQTPNPVKITLANVLPGSVPLQVATGSTPQNAKVLTGYATNLGVVVSRNGVVQPNVAVTFTAPTTGQAGTFPGGATTVTVTSNANGIATAPALIANSILGTFTVVATAEGAFTAAFFELTNIKGDAAKVEAFGGSSPQEILINNRFNIGLQSKVTDAAGNPVSGVTVTFNVPASNVASATPDGGGFTADSGTDGVATLGFTANGIPGSYEVTANVVGVTTPAVFALSNKAPIPTLNADGLTPNATGAGSVTGNNVLQITLNGTNFLPTSQARWNNSPRPTTFKTPTQLTFDIGAADVISGSIASVTVFNAAPGGGTSNGVNFTVNNPIPVISSLASEPAVVRLGDTTSFTLIVTGSGFNSSSKVFWKDSERPTVFVGGLLRATIPASDLATNTNLASIKVVNPPPSGGPSTPSNFTINNPIPTISSISPLQVAFGADATLTITGTKFVTGAQVRWGNNPTLFNTNVINSTSLTVVIPNAAIPTTPNTAVAVAVVNPNPGQADSPTTLSVTIVNPRPTSINVTSNPNPAVIGTGLTLTITGVDIFNGATVKFGATTLPAVFNNGSLTVNVPAANNTTTGDIPIVVENAAPSIGPASPFPLTVQNPVPTINAINGVVVSPIVPNPPVVGSALTLTINGTNFVSTSVVRWNGTNLTTTFVNSTQLTAFVPAATNNTASLNLNVAVFNPGPGGGTATTQIVVNNPVPTINMGGVVVNPNPPTVNTQLNLTINGTNFVSNSVARWNGTDLATTFVNNTQLTTVLPAASNTTIGINTLSVFNPGPGGGTAPVIIIVQNPVPTLTTVTADANPAYKGVPIQLTLTGTNFVSTSVVRWNTTTDLVTTFVNSTQLTATVPALVNNTAGNIPVTVFNPLPGGGLSVPRTVTVINATVVGTGTNGSCTEAAFDTALAGLGGLPGSIIFNCGGAATIGFNNPKSITSTVTIDGGNNITLSGGNVQRFIVAGSANLTAKNITIENGRVTNGFGGAIANNGGTLSLDRVVLRGNQAQNGGGGAVYSSGGTVTINNSTFDNNAVTGNTVGGNGNGGAVYVGGGTVSVRNSTFKGNQTQLNGGAFFVNNGTLGLLNTTVTANQAQNNGGAIFLAAGNASLVHTTIAFNINSGGVAGVTANITAANTIIARNVNSNCSGPLGNGAAAAGNLENDGPAALCGSGVTNGQNDWLLGLALNAPGPTETLALKNDTAAGEVSAAIGLGIASACQTTNVDQRGSPRPATGCDSGAYEAP